MHEVALAQSIVDIVREQARARHRGKRRRDLQLRIIVTAGADPGIGPALVEDIFALAV